MIFLSILFARAGLRLIALTRSNVSSRVLAEDSLAEPALYSLLGVELLLDVDLFLDCDRCLGRGVSLLFLDLERCFLDLEERLDESLPGMFYCVSFSPCCCFSF